MSRVSSCAMVVAVWLEGRKEVEWCLERGGGYDCDIDYMPKSGVSEAAADGGPEMQVVAGAKAGRIECSCRAIRRTDERMMR